MTKQNKNTENSTRAVIYTSRGDDKCFSGYALTLLRQRSSQKPKDHPCSEHLVRSATYKIPTNLTDSINKIEAPGYFFLNDSQQIPGMINYQFPKENLSSVRKLMRSIGEARK